RPRSMARCNPRYNDCRLGRDAFAGCAIRQIRASGASRCRWPCSKRSARIATGASPRLPPEGPRGAAVLGTAFPQFQPPQRHLAPAISRLLPDRCSRAIALVGAPALPRKEKPMFAGIELTPTAALDEMALRDLAARRPPLSQSGGRGGDGGCSRRRRHL